MRIVVIIAFLALMAVLCYSSLVASSRADEMSEKMYKEWKNDRLDKEIRCD